MSVARRVAARSGVALVAAVLLAVRSAAAPARVAAPKVSGAWARSSGVSAASGAVYLTLTSASDDRLIGVRVSPKVAATAELHATRSPTGGAPASAGTTAGTTVAETGTTPTGASTTTTVLAPATTTRPIAMTMRPIESLGLPARTAVSLEPGGTHVMLMGLAVPLRVGSTFELTLRFARAGSVRIRVPVREQAP